MNNAEKYVEFMNKCHSPFHAIYEVEEELKKAGFIKLKENATWKLEGNRYYYVVRNQSSIIAFKIPEVVDIRAINIVASHSDSPSFKLKPNCDLSNDHYNRLNVEGYGGALLSTWLDKPLSIAGRVLVKESGQLVSKLVDFDEDLLIIPNVAIHQNREANNGYKWNIQVDLLPLLGLGHKGDYFNDLLAQKLNEEKENIMAHDLFLYNRQKAILWGKDKEFVSSGRIDNLENVFASLEAFKKAYSKNSINILGVFDNEEVGSTTKQGMGTRFMADVIERIFASFYYTSTDVKAVLANSFLVSADNGHAVHPNHPELYDSTNQSYLNGGVVLKTAASQSYVSDAISMAIAKQLCQRANVPYQVFANRSDSRGGSTQAAASSINVPINAVDVGLAQLAMHSSYETAGSKDIDYMIDFMSEFYNSSIIFDENKVLVVK